MEVWLPWRQTVDVRVITDAREGGTAAACAKGKDHDGRRSIDDRKARTEYEVGKGNLEAKVDSADT